jgi:hypothetical protein
MVSFQGPLRPIEAIEPASQGIRTNKNEVKVSLPIDSSSSRAEALAPTMVASSPRLTSTSHFYAKTDGDVLLSARPVFSRQTPG